VFICVPTTYASVWHDSWMYLTCFTWICHTVYVYVIMSRWFMMHSWMCMTYFTWHVSLICVACQTCQCDSWMCVTCFTWISVIHQGVWHVSHAESWFNIHKWITLIHDAFMNVYDMFHVTCFFDMCGIFHECVWHVSSMSVTWLMNICDTTGLFVWHDSWMRDATHRYALYWRA